MSIILSILGEVHVDKKLDAPEILIFLSIEIKLIIDAITTSFHFNYDVWEPISYPSGKRI